MYLRPATAHDADVITQIYLAARKTFLPYAPLAHSDDAVGVWIRDYLLPDGGVNVAELDGEVVAFLASSVVDDVHWIDQLYVSPQAVNLGAGTRLLTQAIDQLGTVAHPIRLYTFAANTGARRFYERFGFAVVHHRDGSANEEGCPDVLYELKGVAVA